MPKYVRRRSERKRSARVKTQEIPQPFPSVGGGARPKLFWKEATDDGVFDTEQESEHERPK
jgi:hypothetical protein